MILYFLVHEETSKYKTARRIDYEEYRELVESSDQRYELIDGEVYLLYSPAFNHQVVVTEIFWHFHNYFKGRTCRPITAPLDVKLFGYAAKFEEETIPSSVFSGLEIPLRDIFAEIRRKG